MFLDASDIVIEVRLISSARDDLARCHCVWQGRRFVLLVCALQVASRVKVPFIYFSRSGADRVSL